MLIPRITEGSIDRSRSRKARNTLPCIVTLNNRNLMRKKTCIQSTDGEWEYRFAIERGTLWGNSCLISIPYPGKYT